MIAKTALGALAASLLVVLLPLAASLGTLLLVMVAAVFWMSAIHALLATLDAREDTEEVFVPAERAPLDGRAHV